MGESVVDAAGPKLQRWADVVRERFRRYEDSPSQDVVGPDPLADDLRDLEARFDDLERRRRKD